jgi:shikimate kinase
LTSIPVSINLTGFLLVFVINLEKMRICLIGMPGSGKTLIGKKLSKLSGMSFFETDRMIEKYTKLSIPEIFESFGEMHFRHLESEVMDSILKVEDSVISTGGGLPCYFENMKVIKQNCFSVYLELSEEQLIKRLDFEQERKRRPVFKYLNDAEIKTAVSKMLSERSTYYSQADYTLNADDTPEAIIQSILDYLKNLSR